MKKNTFFLCVFLSVRHVRVPLWAYIYKLTLQLRITDIDINCRWLVSTRSYKLLFLLNKSGNDITSKKGWQKYELFQIAFLTVSAIDRHLFTQGLDVKSHPQSESCLIESDRVLWSLCQTLITWTSEALDGFKLTKIHISVYIFIICSLETATFC